ncbi:MAG: general stress protein CsbD [Chitinophagaceae bacterium]|nr:MAG: general stress protein CsbD [Chitinophagaceae bacterium]
MSDTLKLERPWEEVKEKLKEAKMELTDDDLQYSPGQEDALVERLSKKLNKDKEEIRGWIESVSANKAQAG